MARLQQFVEEAEGLGQVAVQTGEIVGGLVAIHGNAIVASQRVEGFLHLGQRHFVG